MKIDGKKSFDTKEYAIIDPDPNVKPKTNCGALKNLLVRGYKTINIATIKLILIVIIGVNISNTRENTDNNTKKAHASFKVKAPDAKGLFFVLSTNLSNL